MYLLNTIALSPFLRKELTLACMDFNDKVPDFAVDRVDISSISFSSSTSSAVTFPVFWSTDFPFVEISFSDDAFPCLFCTELAFSDRLDPLLTSFSMDSSFSNFFILSLTIWEAYKKNNLKKSSKHNSRYALSKSLFHLELLESPIKQNQTN